MMPKENPLNIALAHTLQHDLLQNLSLEELMEYNRQLLISSLGTIYAMTDERTALSECKKTLKLVKKRQMELAMKAYEDVEEPMPMPIDLIAKGQPSRFISPNILDD